MATEDNKLTSQEIEALLREVEVDHTPIRKTNTNRKKRPKVRVDMIIVAVIALAVLIGVVCLIVHFVGNSNKTKDKTVAENALQEEQYPEISDDVKNYLNAFLIEDATKRAEIIAQYVGNLYDINSVKQKSWVSSYSEIECSTKKGPYDNTYIVYAYYQTTLKNISTSVPSIDVLYVVRDTNTGKVYIQNDSGEDIQKYINQVNKDEDVQQLFKSVEKEFEEAKAADPDLNAWFDKLDQAKKAKEAVTTAAQATNTETTGTTQAAAETKGNN